MTHATETLVTSAPAEPVVTAEPLAPSPAAARMRRHRQRKKDRLRCLTIELREREVDALIKKGLLKPEARHVTCDVKMALYAFLEGTLGPKQ
jgi:hypothetical protein